MSGKTTTAIALALAAWLATSANAQIVTLHDINSTAQIDTGSQGGMFHWDNQGQNQLVQQWFWYRIGATGGESSINTIAAPANTLFSGTRGVTTVYDNGSYGVQIDYLLTGGSIVTTGSHSVSDIAETIKIINHTNAPLDFHFYQYSDFDLDGAANDTTQLFKIGSGFVAADQSDGLTGTLTETVDSPKANHGEAGFFPNTLNSLNDALPTTLNDGLAAVGPGDTTWALQWDLSIPAQNGMGPGSIIISKDKSLDVVIHGSGGGVPEPATLAMLSCGVLGLLARRSRKVAK